MRATALCLGMLLLALVVNAQTVAAPEFRFKANEITSLGNGRTVAKRGVELTIGPNVVITADSADINQAPSSTSMNIDLSGNVRLQIVQ